ncbi:MAG: sugar transferase [Candidatus Hodarchaeota archaeon]
MDIITSAFGLIVLCPLLMVLALIIPSKICAPFFFKLMRPGLNGQPFAISQFKAMRDARDANRNLLPASQRVVRLGCFFRAMSLKPPNRFNFFICSGPRHEGLVGPRPIFIQLPLRCH